MTRTKPKTGTEKLFPDIKSTVKGALLYKQSKRSLWLPSFCLLVNLDQSSKVDKIIQNTKDNNHCTLQHSTTTISQLEGMSTIPDCHPTGTQI